MWWAGWAAAATVGSTIDGWAVTLPAGWQSADQGDGTFVVGSPVETGVVVLSWAAGAALPDLHAQAAAPLRDGGLVLGVVSDPRVRSLGAHTGVAADYQGAAADGSKVGAHVVGIAAPGGGLVITGLSPAAALPPLAAKVDAIAASAVFGAPAAGDVHTLRGSLCATAAGDVHAATQRMTFDGAGKVSTGTSFAPVAPRPGAQGWRGDEGTGATYAVAADALVVRWPDGAERRCTIAERGADGLVTAVRCAERRWSAAACPP